MQNAIAQASKMSVAALVSRNAPMTPKAIDFRDERNRGHEEVSHVAMTRKLTPEGDTETLTPLHARGTSETPVQRRCRRRSTSDRRDSANHGKFDLLTSR
jgi:hypothetical protein